MSSSDTSQVVNEVKGSVIERADQGVRDLYSIKIPDALIPGGLITVTSIGGGAQR